MSSMQHLKRLRLGEPFENPQRKLASQSATAALHPLPATADMSNGEPPPRTARACVNGSGGMAGATPAWSRFARVVSGLMGTPR